MPLFKDWPDWFGEAIAVAVSGTAVYIYKTWKDAGEKRRQHRARIIAHLVGLEQLLRASGRLADIQQEKMKDLLKQLETNHPHECGGAIGFEAKFATCYPVMTADERELHGIVRAYTEYSLAPINAQIQDWLRQDEWFKTGAIACEGSSDLMLKLHDLEIHLLLWHAKLRSWLPDQPNHAVVYIADEKQHGLGFPPGTDACVHAVIRELRRLWLGEEDNSSTSDAATK